MEYKEKYFKYKQKYLKLKTQLGGNNISIGYKICDKKNNVFGKIIDQEMDIFILDSGQKINKYDENKKWIKCNHTCEELMEIFKTNIKNKLRELMDRKYLIYKHNKKMFSNIDGNGVLPDYKIIIINENENKEESVGNKIIFKIDKPSNNIFNIKNIKIIQNGINVFDKNMSIPKNNDKDLVKYITNVDDVFKQIYYYIFNTKIYICDWNNVGGRFGNNIMYLIWWCLAFLNKNDIRENIIIGMKNGFIKSKALMIEYYNICIPEIFYPIANTSYLYTGKEYDYKYPLNFKKNCDKNQDTEFIEYNILCKKEFICNLLINLIERETLEKINFYKKNFTNNTCLHYRGSDFCHTKDFNVLHFRYYLESLELIFQNMENNVKNITIDIYNHPDDYEIMELMIIYLQYNLSNKYPDISITFRKEKEIFENLHITKFNELNILYTMSLCKNIIMGNSSLSLWAPFLSQNSTIYYIYKDTSLDKINFYSMYSKMEEILYPLNCINVLNDKNEDEKYYLKYLIPCYLIKSYLGSYYSYHAYFLLLYAIYLNKDMDNYITSDVRTIDNMGDIGDMDDTNNIINNELKTLYDSFKLFKEGKTEIPTIRYNDFILKNYLEFLKNIHIEKNENNRKKYLSDLIDFLSMDKY